MRIIEAQDYKDISFREQSRYLKSFSKDFALSIKGGIISRKNGSDRYILNSSLKYSCNFFSNLSKYVPSPVIRHFVIGKEIYCIKSSTPFIFILLIKDSFST